MSDAWTLQIKCSVVTDVWMKFIIYMIFFSCFVVSFIGNQAQSEPTLFHNITCIWSSLSQVFTIQCLGWPSFVSREDIKHIVLPRAAYSSCRKNSYTRPTHNSSLLQWHHRQGFIIMWQIVYCSHFMSKDHMTTACYFLIMNIICFSFFCSSFSMSVVVISVNEFCWIESPINKGPNQCFRIRIYAFTHPGKPKQNSIMKLERKNNRLCVNYVFQRSLTMNEECFEQTTLIK